MTTAHQTVLMNSFVSSYTNLMTSPGLAYYQVNNLPIPAHAKVAAMTVGALSTGTFSAANAPDGMSEPAALTLGMTQGASAVFAVAALSLAPISVPAIIVGGLVSTLAGAAFVDAYENNDDFKDWADDPLAPVGDAYDEAVEFYDKLAEAMADIATELSEVEFLDDLKDASLADAIEDALTDFKDSLSSSWDDLKTGIMFASCLPHPLLQHFLLNTRHLFSSSKQ